jgi:hypothetical protein
MTTTITSRIAGAAVAIVTDRLPRALLLSGDAGGGDDRLRLSGEASDGDDLIIISGDAATALELIIN